MYLTVQVFSVSTGLGVSIQCLEACEDLHKYGFIHRDLKPANYACGLREKKHIVSEESSLPFKFLFVIVGLEL